MALGAGPDGKPDEFAWAFILVEVVLNIMFIANAWNDPGHHFPTGDYVAQQAGLLTAYGTVLTGRNRWSNNT